MGRLRGDAKHDDGVAGNPRRERSGRFAEVLFGPQVADAGGKMRGIAEILPGVGDIAGRAPEIANVRGPEPGLVGAPLAEAEDDGAAGGLQGVTHGGVGGLSVFRAGVAPIVFEIVDAPGGVLESVLKFMAAAAGTLGASHGAGVGIDAKFQAFGMDVIGEGLDAGGERLGVGDDIAGGVACDLPAIINDDVLVTGALHSAADKSIGGGLDEILGDVATETVPTIPAHGRSESETVIQGARGWNAKERSEEERQRETTYFFRKTIHPTLSAYFHSCFKCNDRTASACQERRARLTSGRTISDEERSCYAVAVAAFAATSAA